MTMQSPQRLLACFLVLIASCASADRAALATPPAGSRPVGALSGKIVFTHGGHGYTASNESDGRWKSLRPLLLGMMEDLGNKDQMDLFVDCLWRTGATIVPMRPYGHQPNEVVLDNTDSAVSFRGEWRVGDADGAFGHGAEEPCRVARTSSVETSTARFQPAIPQTGYYPVYAWAPHGADRAADQLYRVRHQGGVTEVRVNHRRVGHGLVFLGEYHFAEGGDAWVEVSNQSEDSGRVVVADMIRFGNGRGDISRGGGASGLNREDEAGLYWVMWHAQRAGIPASKYRGSDTDTTATVSLPPRYAATMNREAEGPAADRVYVSFHSNAGGGKARGVLGLINGNNYQSSKTPHQEILAGCIAREINDDLAGQRGRFEHDWHDRGESILLDRMDIEFGELNNKYIHDEFDATIIETGFHDNQQDAEMLRDPRVRLAIAEAACQGLIRYFHRVDDGRTPDLAPPEPVVAVSVTSIDQRTVRLRWDAAPRSINGGGPADGYTISTSSDGLAFDAGHQISGASVTQHDLPSPTSDHPVYYRVAAFNRAGQSAPSEVVGCRTTPGARRVLVVGAFDRNDRQLNTRDATLTGGQVDRVRPRESNARNYVRVTAAAIYSASPTTGIDSATHAAVTAGLVSLNAFDAVFWMTGNESTRDQTITPQEQKLLRSYIAQGGRLLVSGSEFALDLHQSPGGRQFCREILGLQFEADSPPDSSRTSGQDDTLFSDLQLRFNSGNAPLRAHSPDVVLPTPGAQLVLSYRGGEEGAGVARRAADARVVSIAAPLESIEGAATRAEVVRRVLRYFWEDQP